MEKFSTESFLNAIEKSKDALIQSKINSFIAYIKTHSFVKDCSFKDGVLDLSFKEGVEVKGNIGNIFLSGGVIKKTSAKDKEKIEDDDFFVVNGFLNI